jgi:hypothetical protein
VTVGELIEMLEDGNQHVPVNIAIMDSDGNYERTVSLKGMYFATTEAVCLEAQ